MKLAFVGFGEVNSPRDLITKKCRQAVDALVAEKFELVPVFPVSDDREGNDIRHALEVLSVQKFDILVICIAGWIPSHTVIRITEEYKHLPVLLWGLAGEWHNGKLITTADQAGTTALRKVFKDLGYTYKYVYNIPGKPFPLGKIKRFCTAVHAMKSLMNKKIGMMGFRDMQLYNTLYDGVSLKAILGIDIGFFDMYEMVQKTDKYSEKQVGDIRKRITQEWDFEQPADPEMLDTGIRYYLSLAEIISEKGYSALSLKDVDGMKLVLKYPPAMIFMLLADEPGICTIPENDTMGAVTQLIIKHLTGQIGGYLEFYEFFENSVLAGVPDFVPGEMVDGRIKVRPANFGGFSGGLLNISKVRTGKVTFCRLSNTGDRYQMHLLTGEAKAPPAWEEAGWDYPAPQLPGLEIVFEQPMDDFATKVSGQHYILAFGDFSEEVRDFCGLTGIEVV